ncbi:MAG: RagB/SusD family nutrient uptake outer membrane protein, partial [Odoribacter sp.]
NTPKGPGSLSLPYRTEFSRDEKSFSTAKDIIAYIEKDLIEADTLLAKDPMYIEFPVASDDETLYLDDFLRYRFKRMNRYAVKALAARVYMWAGDTYNAARMAKEVIDGKDKDGNNYFTLITDNSNDRIYSSELIFSLSVAKFDEQAETDFAISPYSTSFYIYDKSRLDAMFDITTDGANDMRYREGQGFSYSSKSAVSLKYQQKGAYSFAIENTIPLIRLSEMYYIMSECETDLAKSANWLSQVRAARGIDDVKSFKDTKEKEYNIMKEYRKEFYAEGQLWYYYKRLAYKTFQNCPMTIDMTESNYRFSIPDNEKEFGKVN